MEIMKSVMQTDTEEAVILAYLKRTKKTSINDEYNVETLDSKMGTEMEQDAIDWAIVAFVKHKNNNYQIAKYIKEQFDKKYQNYWACIVGNHGSFFHYQPGHYIKFKMRGVMVELFKPSSS